jgi:hypothetical protein
MRVDLNYVLDGVYASCPAEDRAVHCLQPAPVHQSNADKVARQHAMFLEFVNSLANRSRAGVVQSKAASDPHTLYLVSPSKSVAERLHFPWEQKDCCVLVITVPAKHS